MAEWIMGLIGVLLCLFEGYCIQSFFGRFAVPKLCRIRNAGWAGWAAGIAWIVIRAFSEGLFSDTDSVSLIMELLFTFCTLFVFCVLVSGKYPVKDISGCPVHLPAGTVILDGLQPDLYWKWDDRGTGA